MPDDGTPSELANEIDSIAITCDMQHLMPGDDEASPCEKPAAWIATVHDCRKKRLYPNNGTTIPICNDYIETIKRLDFPYRCKGCAQDITSLIMLIWEISRLP